ncbi:hypothetical protein EZV62_018845 [Acer yangbiense]|uniref:NB-ARC domain-containing protein n=1 Tax=Acer yangbiense TaxID=1000413 RepID=A0A5C7H9Y9_9ROSI|nr:hypothetical protein EZV62_018845 [Acer yangbiense]
MIWVCSSLVSFLDGGLPSTNLTSLEITNCKTLEALPNHMQNLTSVRRLTIENYLNIKSFPENGFPTNLISLEIANLKIFDMLFRWGLHRLTYLRELYMEGCPDVVSFPLDERGIMLPTSLTSLSIKDFPNLECLSAIILSLNSMEKLHLVKCPKLKYFPEKGLPLLSELYIDCCPLLEQKCKEDRGQYLSMISHIPAIWINNDWL